jgi:hypothetical protein
MVGFPGGLISDIKVSMRFASVFGAHFDPGVMDMPALVRTNDSVHISLCLINRHDLSKLQHALSLRPGQPV